MAEKLILGVCACPLCGDAGAEIRQGEKNKAYINCDSCVSLIRTMSRRGQVIIRAMLPAAAAAPAAPAVAEKKTAVKKSVFASFADSLP